MKTILVPTDFSANAENSARYAAEVASLAKANLILLHVCSVPVPVADVPVAMIPIDEVEKQCTADLETLKKKLADSYPEIGMEAIVKTGFVIEEILLTEEEMKADLIVMAVTGTGKASDVLGTDTTAIMKKAKSPVLAIPAGVKFAKPEKMALACDFTAIVPDAVTDTLKYYIGLFGSKLLVFDVLKPAELVTYQKAAAEVNLENSLSDINHSLYYPAGNDLEKETNEFLERNNAGMLVMIPHNHSFLHGVFHFSKTKKMTLHTHIPVLSIHE